MSERRPLDLQELDLRIGLNYHRLATDPYYSFEDIFSPVDYTWFGDKEGRALLAFVCHCEMGGEAIPCMEAMLSELKPRVNGSGYLGPVYSDAIHEQQLSGHSWLLRGLCAHYQLFADGVSLEYIRKIAENLYLPLKGAFSSYPVNREKNNKGGVSGSDDKTVGKWILSTDVGCAFMSIDGLSHAYCVLQDPAIKALVEEMTSVYLSIDKVALRAQTHCTLTAARGMLRMYRETGETFYLDGAGEILDLYVHGGGMTETYQNLNWWGRPNTWTEPCAIVDSFMVAGELYKITKDEKYRVLASRIYHNGLATAQRDNGGAGTDSIVAEGGESVLRAQMYEAYFCCTMRLAEGFSYLKRNPDLFSLHLEGAVTKKGRRYSDGDLLYGEVSGGAERYGENFVTVDGLRLCPIVKYYKVPKEIMEASSQRILF